MRNLEIRFMEYQKAVEKSDKNLERAKKRNKFHHARLEAIKKQIDSQVEPGTMPHPDYVPSTPTPDDVVKFADDIAIKAIQTEETPTPEEKPNEPTTTIPE